jgi:hypothetical protein
MLLGGDGQEGGTVAMGWAENTNSAEQAQGRHLGRGILWLGWGSCCEPGRHICQ